MRLIEKIEREQKDVPKAIDIAEAAHRRCITTLIPDGISPLHDVIKHMETSSFYADALEAANIEATGEEVIDAIWAAKKWDGKTKWSGHPHPKEVIKELIKAKEAINQWETNGGA